MTLADAIMGRTLDSGGLRDLLDDNPEHPRWERLPRVA